MYETVETNSVTGEITIRQWTQEEIEARKQRLRPHQWDALRQERNQRLLESDRYVYPDRWFTYNEAVRQAWTDYRQALRDLPENTTDPFSPVWPEKPF